jgi:hypothetical protein
MSEKRAAAYVRVSTDRQAREGLSLDEQRRRVERHIEAQGWTRSSAPTSRPACPVGRTSAQSFAACLRTSIEAQSTLW